LYLLPELEPEQDLVVEDDVARSLEAVYPGSADTGLARARPGKAGGR
jgi:hypothetical protein